VIKKEPEMKKAYLIKGLPDSEIAPEISEYIEKKFKIVRDPASAKFLIVFGGDGTMLKNIRLYRELNLPFFGLNYGHVGFLLNAPTTATLDDLLHNRLTVISSQMLQAVLYDKNGEKIGTEFAFNDFYFERSTLATAKIRVSVNSKVRFDPLICDGAIVASAAGSTAYNAAAGGIILPIGDNSMVLTGICPAVFHRWRSIQLDAESKIILEAMDFNKRPVRFLVDKMEIENVVKAEIGYSDKTVRLLFANSQDFREKRLEFIF